MIILYISDNTILRYDLTDRITYLTADMKEEKIAELSIEDELNLFLLILF